MLELCGATDYIDRAQLKQQLKCVFVARNWFAGHGSCMLNDVRGALIALKEVLRRMCNLPCCPPALLSALQLASAAVDKQCQRVNVSGAASLPPCSLAFVMALRAFEQLEAAASAASGQHVSGFDKVVVELKACAAAKLAANVFSGKDVALFTAHAEVVFAVRNRVFHSTRDITASMMDAVHCAAEVLRMLGCAPESQLLRNSRHDFLISFRDSCLASPLPVQVASAVCQIAHNCPFFLPTSLPEYCFDGSSSVCTPVMSHVLKGSLKAPGITPCDCLGKIPKGDIAAVMRALGPLCDVMTRVPQFYSLDASSLRCAVAANASDLQSCGQVIVRAFPPGHQCGLVSFTDDADGHVRAVQHLILCKLKHGSYDAACQCASGIGYLMRDDCGSTANKDTKKCIKDWHCASAARIPLLPSNADVTDIDAFVHVLECDAVNKAVAPAACVLSLPVTVSLSDQAGVQAFVDSFSGESLVDREVQVGGAVAALQRAATGSCAAGGMCAALICGAPGTGKSHCGEEVLYRLSKLQERRRCMEKVTCRSAAAVKSGLVLLGRRMGKTLGVGPETSAADVLDMLKKHLAVSPCVTSSCVCVAWFHAFVQVRDHVGRCVERGPGRGAFAASRQRRGQRFAGDVVLDQNRRCVSRVVGPKSGRGSRARCGAAVQRFE